MVTLPLSKSLVAYYVKYDDDATSSFRHIQLTFLPFRAIDRWVAQVALPAVDAIIFLEGI